MISEELYTHLSDVALVAARHGFVAEADEIFDTLLATVPHDDRAQLAKAISRIYLKRADEAVSIIKEQILSVDPRHPYARGFLGFAYKMAGFPEDGNRELRNLIAENEHPTVVEFAVSLLEDPAFDDIEPMQPELPDTYMSPIMFC